MSISVRSSLAHERGRLRLMEAHDQASCDLVRHSVNNDGHAFQGIWISGLTQTTYLGIPDTEMISPLERASLITFTTAAPRAVCREVCFAFDADSGGPMAEIPALVRKLSSMGVSMAIIEDKEVSKPGGKVNSLAASSASQGQANMHDFARTIAAFREVASADFMVTARIESFTTRAPKKDAAEDMASIRAALEDALIRAHLYCAAGADAIMIHSKSKQPDEILDFTRRFRVRNRHTPVVVVPTTYSTTPEDVLYNAGANVVIYANHLMRAKIRAATLVSDGILATNPDVLADEPRLAMCASSRNFGCLLARLDEMENTSKAIEQYGKDVKRGAVECMQTVLTSLLDAKASGGADRDIVSVKDLLSINSVQVTFKLGSTSWPDPGDVPCETSKQAQGSIKDSRWYTFGWLGVAPGVVVSWVKTWITRVNA
ncbi:transcriptional regulator [Purpureocillium lavendulum]|uniref:Transcriptional regulator n=1 Tax=Purpureocillium lavendulum TaxID=1247861 RepID=A0AB34G5R9_9HYPO|nr:transcriptional regulator [Purpureocillium lavendulum]